MTQNFDSWFADLCSNYVWYEPAKMKHKPETFKAIANAVYMQYVGAEKFPTIQDARVHVYRKVVLTPGDLPKVDWTKAAKKELDEKEKAKEEPPLTGEARAKKLAEVKAIIDSMPKKWTPPEMSEEEKEREGVLRKKHEPFVRSEVETMEVFNQHKMKVDEARRKYFLSAYPNAEEEEIQAYLNKFKAI
jgi:hypothetical protein